MTVEQTQRRRQIIRLPQVMERVGLKSTAIYEAMALGTFPRPVKLGPRAAGWLEDEIDTWLAERIAKRDAKLAPPQQSKVKVR